MPITGTFLADFTQFDSAVQGAGSKLRAFEGEAGKTGVALKGMESASQTLSTRMVALGAAVGSFIGNFAFGVVQQGVSSLIAMGQEAFTSAGRIIDLSNKTGLTTDTIQRMNFVAEQTGGTLDQFTQAAFMLGSRLSGGSGSVQKAVEELGVSFQALQTMRPDQQFDTIVGALGRMDDATKRNELGVAIFGRSFSTIAAAVSEGYGTLADAATVSSNAQLQALDKLADRWKAFTTTTTTQIQAWLAKYVIAFEEADLSGAGFIEMHRRLKKAFEDAAAPAEDYASQLKALAIHLGTEVIPKQDTYTVQLAKAKAEVAALDAETRKEIEAAKALGISTDDLTAKFGLSETAIRLVIGQISTLSTKSTEAAVAMERLKAAAQWDQGLTSEGFLRSTSFTPQMLQGPMAGASHSAEVERAHGAVEEANAFAAAQEEANRMAAEGVLVVGQYAAANKAAGEAAAQATQTAVQGYAAVGQQVTMTGDAIRAWIQLQERSAKVNAILAENPLFMGLGAAQRIANLPASGGGGGGITVINNNQGAFLNTPADTQRLAERTGAAVRDQLMSHGRQVT